MGILNVTPDSFSDGGRFFDFRRAVDHGLELARDGAAILDVGGESTRPGSEPITTEEELRRVVPVVAALAEHFARENHSEKSSPVISVDTQKAIVAREALAAGAEMLNDVSALRFDPEMLEVVLESQTAVCLMHMQGEPRTMQIAPAYAGDDPLPEICEFLRERRDFLIRAGADPSRIVLDPGLGFGKTAAHNERLVQNIAELQRLGQPLLVGHSRKRFLDRSGNDSPSERDAATLELSLRLARSGVRILRVHNVAVHRAAFATMLLVR